MSKRIATVVAGLVAAGTLAGCSMTQPPSGCIVQDAAFANWQAKFTPKTPEDAAKPCGNLKGDVFGVFKYNDPTKPNSAQLALRGRVLASLGSRPGVNPKAATAIGQLPAEPDANSFCTVASMAKAEVVAPEYTNASGTLVAATTAAYEFTNVRVYANPQAPGTQLSAELKYTRDGCTAEYKVSAVWPETPCDPTSSKPVETCKEGSGINPDFAVICDDGLNKCVLAKDVPSLN